MKLSLRGILCFLGWHSRKKQKCRCAFCNKELKHKFRRVIEERDENLEDFHRCAHCGLEGEHDSTEEIRYDYRDEKFSLGPNLDGEMQYGTAVKTREYKHWKCSKCGWNDPKRPDETIDQF